MYVPGTKSNVRAWDYRPDHPDVPAYESPGDDVLQPGFDQFLSSLYERQDELKKVLFVAIAEMFGLEPDTFSQHCAEDMGEIRLLHYPGLAGDDADFGISAHTDVEALTLMHQDAPGLQFIPRDTGEWIDAPVRPGEFVVIVGDTMERFTNGVLAATPHRVVLTPHARNSIVRFFTMHPDTEVRPLAPFLTEGLEAKYTPVTVRRHVAETLKELEDGEGCWDSVNKRSKTATREYS